MGDAGFGSKPNLCINNPVFVFNLQSSHHHLLHAMRCEHLDLCTYFFASPFMKRTVRVSSNTACIFELYLFVKETVIRHMRFCPSPTKIMLGPYSETQPNL